MHLHLFRRFVKIEKEDKMADFFKSKGFRIAVKVLLTLIVVVISPIFGMIAGFGMFLSMFWEPLCWLVVLILPLVIPIIWLRKKKPYLIGYGSFTLALLVAIGTNFGIMKYDELITVDTAPNIKVEEYLPFREDSKIVKLDNASLTLTENLPRIDGAAAVFPVYSAFVHAVYPDTTLLAESWNNSNLAEEVFQYNNTYYGYRYLAEKKTDIFFGAKPSQEQIDYAKSKRTTFKLIPIGSEAFVFFVHKDNPVDSLTIEQVKGIYSGKITNWKEVGGRNEEIVAFQRNEGSGSQSMLKRFMGDTPIMEAPKDQINDWMVGIIEEVADYKSRSGSIGFSFRYYVEGIIQNPDIKIVAIDGVYPSIETIKNGSYPITTPLYAVTYYENKNPNVDALIEWILSEEGQYIIEQTGYVGVSDTSYYPDIEDNEETTAPEYN